ncbi:MAG: hypothetical protein GX756_01320 [Clostridiales bacterium]|nr:hypothetical protein [Clostridiales bacterium]
MYCEPEHQNQPEKNPRKSIAQNILCWCADRILCFLLILFALTLGLILGAVFDAAILTALPALIVLAVLLLVLIIVTLIIKRCKCCEKDRCEN